MYRILLAGFGGQGILFAGKQIAKTAMHADKFVTWLPSYGPEMRGGTCNCSVIISDDQIGSPLVTEPDILIAMNLPSLDKFESSVVSGGSVFIDSSLISRKCVRSDIKAFYIPASELAEKNNLSGMANVIFLGAIIAKTQMFEYDYFLKLLTESIPASKAHLIEINKKALDLGYNYTI